VSIFLSAATATNPEIRKIVKHLVIIDALFLSAFQTLATGKDSDKPPQHAKRKFIYPFIQIPSLRSLGLCGVIWAQRYGQFL
jgi:hypothetical protein